MEVANLQLEATTPNTVELASTDVDGNLSILEMIRRGLRARGVVIDEAAREVTAQGRHGAVTGFTRREIVDICHIAKPALHRQLENYAEES